MNTFFEEKNTCVHYLSNATLLSFVAFEGLFFSFTVKAFILEDFWRRIT